MTLPNQSTYFRRDEYQRPYLGPLLRSISVRRHFVCGLRTASRIYLQQNHMFLDLAR